MSQHKNATALAVTAQQQQQAMQRHCGT